MLHFGCKFTWTEYIILCELTNTELNICTLCFDYRAKELVVLLNFVLQEPDSCALCYNLLGYIAFCSYIINYCFNSGISITDDYFALQLRIKFIIGKTELICI